MDEDICNIYIYKDKMASLTTEPPAKRLKQSTIEALKEKHAEPINIIVQ